MLISIIKLLSNLISDIMYSNFSLEVCFKTNNTWTRNCKKFT